MCPLSRPWGPPSHPPDRQRCVGRGTAVSHLLCAFGEIPPTPWLSFLIGTCVSLPSSWGFGRLREGRGQHSAGPEQVPGRLCPCSGLGRPSLPPGRPRLGLHQQGRAGV